MSTAPAPDEIMRDAQWLVQAMSPGADVARLVEMSRESYRAASFLDDRMFEQPRTTHIVDWNLIAAAAGRAGARRDARWIFHIGHVGSTLISRLLGEIDGVLSIREPRAMRDLLFFPSDVRASLIPKLRTLMSRTFDADEVAVLKVTSVVTELASELIGPGNASLFLFASPRAYIQTLLAGEDSGKDLRILADSRSGRLEKRRIWMDDKNKSAAHLAAAAWACEMTALEEAQMTLPGGAIMWHDFDRFLSNPVEELRSIATHLGVSAEVDQISEIVGGPWMHRYSKLPEYDYSPNLRRELLDEAGLRFRIEIDSAVEMLKKAARASPLLESAMNRAASET